MNHSIDMAMESYINFNIGLVQSECAQFKEHHIVAYYGDIGLDAIEQFHNVIKDNVKKGKRKKKLLIILHTGGGVVEVVEKFVEVSRYFYNQIDFLVPEYAMSAGTIWCMSGDNIYMNYASSLGPIDPQVRNNNGKWIPALAYLEKFNEFIEKSRDNQLTNAELLLLNNLDLAELERYQQAANLSVDLLKQWLFTYKFKDWTKHKTNPERQGETVTDEEKRERARKIAVDLNNTSKWRSHNRFISMRTLQKDLRLLIEDYSNDTQMMYLIDKIHTLILQFLQKTGLSRVILGYAEQENENL